MHLLNQSYLSEWKCREIQYDWSSIQRCLWNSNLCRKWNLKCKYNELPVRRWYVSVTVWISWTVTSLTQLAAKCNQNCTQPTYGIHWRLQQSQLYVGIWNFYNGLRTKIAILVIALKINTISFSEDGVKTITLISAGFRTNQNWDQFLLP